MHTLENFLLAGLEVRASVFHVGHYCDHWETSLQGQGKAGFHVVLYGPCWLHFPQRPSVCLHPGEAVFFLRDVPHVLSPISDAPDFTQPLKRQLMQALGSGSTQGTGLLCGFLRFKSVLADFWLRALPDTLYLSGSSLGSDTALVVQLIQQEAQSGAAMNTLVLERLIELLLFYRLRVVTHHPEDDSGAGYGLLTLAQDPHYSQLLVAIMNAPAYEWSVDDMAEQLHTSRASFHRRFTLLTGMTPAQLLLLVRVHLAKPLLLQGFSIEYVADELGYGSAASFSAAFKRVEQVTPSVWRERQNTE